MLIKLYQSAAILTALFLLVACSASKKTHEDRIYLQGIDSINNSIINYPEQKIQKGDLLTINVFSDNKEATEIYNQQQVGGGGAVGGTVNNMVASGRGYLVDNNGNIYFHTLGSLSAAGLTKQELGNSIREKILPFLQNPYVIVRYANSKITVLGEVAKPGQIDLPDQRLSILDAISLSGDLTPFGRRDRILLIREINGIRKVEKIDIRRADIYNSPNFYLQQNDLIYVEPNRKKPTGNEQMLMRNIAITTSVLSVVTLLVTIITR